MVWRGGALAKKRRVVTGHLRRVGRLAWWLVKLLDGVVGGRH